MKSRIIKLVLILFVTATPTYFLWHDDASPRAVATIDPVAENSPIEPPPIEPDSLKIGPNTITSGTETHTTHSTDPTEGVSVRGRITNKLDEGISDMRIEISLKNSLLSDKNIYSAFTDYRGEFLFDALPPNNSYRLEVLASGNYSGILLDSFPVQQDRSVETIILDSVELVTVEGMIVDTEDLPVANFEMLVQNVDIAYPGRVIVSDTSGFFQLSQFPSGDLQLSTRGDEDFKITGIRLEPGQYRNLTLALDKGGYHLSGWVSDEFDAPIAQARVVLTSTFSRQDYQSTSYRFKVTNSYGGFKFSELGGQKHQITVDAIGYQTTVLDYRFHSFSDNLTIRMQPK